MSSINLQLLVNEEIKITRNGSVVQVQQGGKLVAALDCSGQAPTVFLGIEAGADGMEVGGYPMGAGPFVQRHLRPVR